VNETKLVVDKFKANNIPLEAIWNDIDYMDIMQDFTWEPKKFPVPQMKQFVDSLHANHQRYILIIDPGIKLLNGYSAYDELIKNDLCIKQPNGNPAVNMVWPGIVVYPDFTKDGTHTYWQKQIHQFLDQGVDVDGLWIDMNEVCIVLVPCFFM
jgi:alpha-glucosidase (family GH31 glycosyl hydrolase)